MSYTKYTWETGEVITAAKLNHIEDGIAAIGSVQYTVEFTGSSLVFKAPNNAVKAGDTGVDIGPDGSQFCYIVLYAQINEDGAEHIVLLTIDDNTLDTIILNEWVYSDEAEGFIIAPITPPEG